MDNVEKEYVKRIIGLPGERLAVKAHKVYINGNLLEEPWLAGNKVTDEDIDPDLSENFSETDPIPPGHYFVMGDNRINSSDSRVWGFLKSEYIIGKPWRIYWSYDSKKEDYVPPSKEDTFADKGFFNKTKRFLVSIAHKIGDIVKTIINFIPKTRWNRTLKYLK